MTRRAMRRLLGSSAPRPVMTEDQIMDLCHKVLGFSTVGSASVQVSHTARSVTQLAHGKVVSEEDGDRLQIIYRMAYNHAPIEFMTDESDLNVLHTMVQRLEKMMLDTVGKPQEIEPTGAFQDVYVPVHLWHDATIDAMQSTRDTLFPEIVQPITQAGLVPSGFVGFLARSRATVTKDSRSAYFEESDCEISVTARTPDDTSSGWWGQANRDWQKIDPAAVTAKAIDLAKRGVNPRAFEPGKRTVILTPEAVAQLVRFYAYFYAAVPTEHDEATPFWRRAYPANKVGLKVFDERITMSSDPGDEEGGYRPYWDDAFANSKMTWAQNGILKNLAHDQYDGPSRDLTYNEPPMSIRISGGTTSMEQMISQCELGIYVNHFGNVQINPSVEGRRAGVLTGTTRDGCFLVKNGKLDIPLKNYRFIDSPMFMLNNIIALGPTRRAAYGYTPTGEYDPPSYDPDDQEWPRRPIIVPPIMSRDFNFTSLADAV